MNSPRIHAAELAAFMSGRPSLVVNASLPGIETLRPTGFAVWLLDRREGQTVLRSEGFEAASSAEGKLAQLKLPPPGAMVVLSAQEADVADFVAWWADKSGQPAPLVLVADVAAALPEVLGRVAAEIAAVHARCVELERNLALTRIDYEDTRIVIAAVSRTLGNRPPAALTLSLSLEPSTDLVSAPDINDRLQLRQPLGRKLEGLAAIAVHVGAISASTSGPLRVRISGEESSRIVASWTVPMEQLSVGWLVLDLPNPLGPERETAVLEITADVAEPHSLALSLERNWVPSSAACTVADGSESGRALALRLWTARIGDRFVVPAYWNWDEAGSTLPLAGVPQAVSPAEWRAVRAPVGDWSGLDEAEVAPMLRLTGTGTAVLVLPRVTMAGTDVLRLAWTMTGAGLPIMIAAWAVSPEHSFNGFQAMPPDASFSGWRQMDADTPGHLTMLLPVSLGRQAKIVLAVESLDPAAEVNVEITDLSLLPTRDPAELRRLRAMVPKQQALPAEGQMRFERIELHQHLVGNRNYQHLDLLVHGLEGAGLFWPQLRFKLALNGNRPQIEFRRGKGWPEVFVRWPGSDSDQFGPVMRARPAEVEKLKGRLANDRDVALMTTLLSMLEKIVQEGARLATLPEDVGARWVNAARDLNC